MANSASARWKSAPFADVPSVAPSFQFAKYARELVDRLLAVTPPQYTLGILGGYGTGKTTLMRAMEGLLRKQREIDPTLQIVWFDAWCYDQEECLFLPLLAQLLREPSMNLLEQHKNSLINAARAIISGISLKFSPIEFSAKEALRREAELQHNEIGDIRKLTEGYDDVPQYLRELAYGTHPVTPELKPDRRIIVFVDDLDRCLPAKAFGMIEAIKAFTNAPGWIWVIGMDSRVISSQVIAKYGETFSINSKEYFEKIFNQVFALPPLQMPANFSELKKALYGENSDRSDEQANADLIKYLIPLISYLPSNVRQVKRILNTAHTIVSIHEVDPALVISLLILQSRWPLAFGLLHESRNNFRTIMKSLFSGDGTEFLIDEYKSTEEWRIAVKEGKLKRLYEHIGENRTDEALTFALNHLGQEVEVRTGLRKK